MRKFSTVQIVGFFLSLVWVLFSIYSDYNKTETFARQISESEYERCIETQIKSNQPTSPSCLEQKKEKYETYSESWSTHLAMALLPVPFFWLYGFILLTISRCFRYGSKSILDISGYGFWKKGFAYFCYLISFLTILFSVIAAMIAYQKFSVPVGLSYSTSMYVDSAHGYATAEGTWISHSDAGKNEMINPLQTSRIVCQIQYKECIEARAVVLMLHRGSPYLKAEEFRYEITSWNKDSIVFKDSSGFCFDKVYTYDLNSKTIVGVEKFSNGAFKNCQRPEKWRRETTYQLVAGYPVEEELSAKARPWLLRVFFSLFQ